VTALAVSVGRQGASRSCVWATRHDPCVGDSPRFATDPDVVASEAAVVAAAWSGPATPDSWRLIAAQLGALRDDPELRALAASAPPDRLPALLFTAAATRLVLTLEPEPLCGWFPRVGEEQASPPKTFGSEYRAFCLDHRDELLALMAAHRYQMNEVGRCAGLVLALDPELADGRAVTFVDVGTGAGLALHFDRYAYRFVGPATTTQHAGADGAAVAIDTQMLGSATPLIPERLPTVVERIGIDVEPLAVADADVRGWLAACIPQTIEAVTRFERAVEVVLSEPATMIRGDAVEVLADTLRSVPADRVICVQDSYVSVFFDDAQRRRLREVIEAVGVERDLDWISIDPLVPLGATATDTVLGARAPQALITRNHDEGVFGAITRRSYRDGQRREALIGIAHPGAAWHEWLMP
jgi:hypothetical protein